MIKQKSRFTSWIKPESEIKLCLLAVLIPFIYGTVYHYYLGKMEFVSIDKDLMRTPNYTSSVNISIKGEAITYDNKPFEGKLLYLKSSQEGIMLQTVDDDLKVWKSGIQFYSQTIYNKKQIFVNQLKKVQDQNMIQWICINTTNNKATQRFNLKAITRVWSLDQFWLQFFELQFILCYLVAYFVLLEYTRMKLTAFKERSRFRRYCGIIFRVGLLVYTLFKDIWYLLAYHHYNGVVVVVIVACITGILYTYYVKLTHGDLIIFKNIILQPDIEGQKNDFLAKCLMWEFNYWLIIAIICDTFYMGKQASLFSKTSMLVSSVSIALGLGKFAGQYYLEKQIWKKEGYITADTRSLLIQVIIYLGTYLILVGHKFYHIRQPILYKEKFNIKQQHFYGDLNYVVGSVIFGFFCFILRKKVIYERDYKNQRQPLETCAVKQLLKYIVEKDPSFKESLDKAVKEKNIRKKLATVQDIKIEEKSLVIRKEIGEEDEEQYVEEERVKEKKSHDQKEDEKEKEKKSMDKKEEEDKELEKQRKEKAKKCYDVLFKIYIEVIRKETTQLSECDCKNGHKENEIIIMNQFIRVHILPFKELRQCLKLEHYGGDGDPEGGHGDDSGDGGHSGEGFDNESLNESLKKYVEELQDELVDQYDELIKNYSFFQFHQEQEHSKKNEEKGKRRYTMAGFSSYEEQHQNGEQQQGVLVELQQMQQGNGDLSQHLLENGENEQI